MVSVGIVGLDYCGSTLINNVLSGLPGCIGVGESHWIIDHEKSKKKNVDRCTECGSSDCPVFTTEVISNLRKEENLTNGNWWSIIAESSNSDYVISGDKRPFHYERLGVPDKLIFAIKDPRAHLVSWAIRKFHSEKLQDYNKGISVIELSDDDFNFSLNFWIRETRKHITWSLSQEKPIIAVSLESFIEDDSKELEIISKWMGCEFDESALNYWETDLHYIGGNHSVKRLGDERYFFKKLRLDKRWQQVLSSDQQNQIYNDPVIREQLDRIIPFAGDGQTFFHD